MRPPRPGRRAAAAAAVLCCLLAVPVPPAPAASPKPAASRDAAGDPASWLAFTGGRLVYGQDARGNRVPDFSSAGYAGGTRPLPTAADAVTLQPAASGDDTARIQQALDRVAALPPGPGGLRGAVRLAAGRYRVGNPLRITASGVVLRGAGSGSDGTLLLASGDPRALVELAGTGEPTRSGPAHAVADAYVPVGASVLTLDSAAGLTPGQQVVVQRPQEDGWIHAIGMDAIPARDDGTASHPWPAGAGLQFRRTVTAVDGNRITLDAPLTNALEREYTHAVVWPYAFPGRISQVGVESLSADGFAFTEAAGYDTGGYFKAALARFSAVQDGWLRDVTADRFGAGIGSIGDSASRITFADTAATRMDQAIPQRAPFAQPAAYSVDGQQNLVTGCRVTGSNLHAWTTGPRVAGPNVFTRCTSENTGRFRLDAGPHQRWATGTLYDCLTMRGSRGPADDLALTDRSNAGSGQGWAGANQVMWNADVDYFAIQQPPTAHNWAFGTRGTPVADQADGIRVSDGAPVEPACLYPQQLAERTSAGAPQPVPDAPSGGPGAAPSAPAAASPSEGDAIWPLAASAVLLAVAVAAVAVLRRRGR
ncbi:hypothetical protein AB0K51_28015 [Kitasatospora sp. NPDC049285]|uniref:hypothetical protein n=1 Tax=Kitasatospora sp. NPDC049285 TaxID=3157096 RepID=UPI003438C577